MKNWMKCGICLFLAVLLSACGGQTPPADVPAVPEATVLPTETAASAPTEETVPPETKPESYTVNGITFASALGEPILGEAAAELAEGDLAIAAEQIANVGDAISYMLTVTGLNEPEAACQLFADLLERDYDEVGLIHVSRQDNNYFLVYIQQDGVFYPFSPFDFSLAYGEVLWPSAPRSGTDLDALCQKLMATFPFNENNEPMTDYRTNVLSSTDFYKANGILYAEELGAPVLGEEAAGMAAARDIAAAAEKISNVGDAIHYIKTLPRFNDPKDACQLFADLLDRDYDEVGIIHLWQPANHYFVAYVRQDGIFYPFDPLNFRNGYDGYSWPGPRTVSTDLDALCGELMPTFPHDRNGQPMTSYSTETISSLDFYKANGILYGAKLGEPVLGEKAAELASAGDIAAAVEQVTNVGDVIHYMKTLQRLKNPIDACQIFVDLLQGDYDEVGVIHLSRTDNNYFLTYVQRDGVYYPFDPFNFHSGRDGYLWPSAATNSTDLNALCEELVSSFPYGRNGDPMTAYETEVSLP